jgi:hypothetical protein
MLISCHGLAYHAFVAADKVVEVIDATLDEPKADPAPAPQGPSLIDTLREAATKPTPPPASTAAQEPQRDESVHDQPAEVSLADVLREAREKNEVRI